MYESQATFNPFAAVPENDRFPPMPTSGSDVAKWAKIYDDALLPLEECLGLAPIDIAAMWLHDGYFAADMGIVILLLGEVYIFAMLMDRSSAQSDASAKGRRRNE